MSITHNDITDIITKLYNKYTYNIDQKYYNQLYDIGIIIVNKNYDHNKLVHKLTNLIAKLSCDNNTENERNKRVHLINALKKGITDATTNEYRTTYNNYDFLVKRALRDRVLDDYDSFYH